MIRRLINLNNVAREDPKYGQTSSREFAPTIILDGQDRFLLQGRAELS
jgi:hypothetical protein